MTLRRTVFQLRLTPLERKALARAAAEQGMTASAYVRWLILTATKEKR